MLALLLCQDRECRSAYEAEGSRDSIDLLRCADCGGPLLAKGWADAEPRERGGREAELRRAA